jgi:hypothetical protein
MKFKINQEVVMCSYSSDIVHLSGRKAEIIEFLPPPNANDYVVNVEAYGELKVRENEIQEIKPEYLKFAKDGIVIYIPTNEKVHIEQIDYLHGMVEITHNDGSQQVVEMNSLRELGLESESLGDTKLGKFADIALEIGKFTDKKNKQYGSSVDATYKMIQALMERYTYDDENYLMPKDLLKHILLQVRMMDKQNRIFNNPTGKGDSESPYNDLAGYSLIGIDMVRK